MGVIRLILALSVVIEHSGGTLLGFQLFPSHVAVFLFFVISGFYISLILNEKYIHMDRMKSRFFGNRVLRLFPTYFVVCFLTVVFLSWTGSHNIFTNPMPSLSDLQRWGYLVLNIGIVGQGVLSSFSPLFHQIGNHAIPPAWTISVELLFYMVAPFLILLRSRRLVLACVGIFAVLVSVRLLLQAYPQESVALVQSVAGMSHEAAQLLVAAFPGRYRLFPLVLPLFLLGYASYVIYTKVKFSDAASGFGRNVVILLVVLFVFEMTRTARLNYAWDAGLDSLRLWTLYILFAGLLPFIFIATRHNTIDNFLGSLSYPVYIVHILAIYFVRRLWPDPETLPFPDSTTVMVGFALAGAVLLFFFVEHPVEKVRRRIARGFRIEESGRRGTAGPVLQDKPARPGGPGFAPPPAVAALFRSGLRLATLRNGSVTAGILGAVAILVLSATPQPIAPSAAAAVRNLPEPTVVQETRLTGAALGTFWKVTYNVSVADLVSDGEWVGLRVEETPDDGEHFLASESFEVDAGAAVWVSVRVRNPSKKLIQLYLTGSSGSAFQIFSLGAEPAASAGADFGGTARKHAVVEDHGNGEYTASVLFYTNGQPGEAAIRVQLLNDADADSNFAGNERSGLTLLESSIMLGKI